MRLLAPHSNEVVWLNYGTLKTRVAWYLDRTDLTSPVSSLINDVRLDLATPLMPDGHGGVIMVRWPWLWTDAYLNTTIGTADYSLPNDYLDHLLVKIGEKKLHGYMQKDWDEQMCDDVDQTESNGEPCEYVVVGQTLRLHPPPDSVYTLRLYYYARPTDFTQNSDSDYMSNTYPYLIIHAAVVLAATFLDDDDKLKKHSVLFDKILAKAVMAEKTGKTQDVATVMRTFKDYATTTTGVAHFKNRFRVRS